MEKRRFRNNTQQVVAEVQACLKNAVQLGAAATEQLHAKRQAESVAVLDGDKVLVARIFINFYIPSPLTPLVSLQ